MNLILVPAVISLAITVLRLVGEFQNWSPALFSKEAGGGGAVVGISWLAPVFGIYFALKLSSAGEGPSSVGRPILFSLLGVVIMAAGFTGALALSQPGQLGAAALVTIASVVALLVQRKPWPSLFRTTLAYGYAARIPVAVLMFFAIMGDWGTHYDVPPTPDFPAMHWVVKWLLIGAIPQLIIWIAFTVITGTLFGSIAVAIFHRGRHGVQAAQT
jgi:hypothetical protein